MDSSEIRKRFLEFFSANGHKIVPSSSLIPADPSVLLTTAGMQQFKPYYTGEADPLKDFGSRNTASVQKSFRTSDIDEVGDETHDTFFEMLGNFSFGDYFKEEAIRLAYDFFKVIELPIQYVTVFEGDPSTHSTDAQGGERSRTTNSGQVVPADAESERIWEGIGITDIRKKGRADNFWGPTGSEGPCGPTTEIYIRDTEIWNIVFNEYYQKSDKSLEKLKQSGVDTGMGLERLAMVLQQKANIFETDLFAPFVELLPDSLDVRKRRIIADHLRGACFLIADDVQPSNKGAGYVLRRLLRRIFVFQKLPTQAGLQSFDTQPSRRLQQHVLDAIVHEIIQQYGSFYPELAHNAQRIENTIREEWEKFSLVLARGIREFRKAGEITPAKAFNLYQSCGLPLDSINDLIRESGSSVRISAAEFQRALEKHQEISRAGQEKKFGGHGLILDTGELKAGDEEELKIVTRLHTATHLLNAALHKVLRPAFSGIEQRGSDITAERTRFDFLFPRRLTKEEIEKIEGLVNYAIEKDFPVAIREMPLEEAKRSGALFFYKGHYPEQVTVYTVGNDTEVFSRELCGGPHVPYTGEIGKFRITKEESSSAGVRRIRAIVES